MRILKQGSTGEAVFILQQRLKELGFFPETITGSYGYETTNAVLRYQENNGLTRTGEVNEDMWNRLEKQTANNGFVPKTKSILNRPVLRYRDQNEYVRELQNKLKTLLYFTGEPTGFFGNETLEAVKSFQLNNRLTADGIVGKDTWSALTYLYSPLASCNGTGGNTGGSTDYIVKSGDSLWLIANKFGTTVAAIKELNNLTSNTIYIGQSLKIPSSTTSVYTVKQGDSLWSIARNNNTTVAELKSLNNLTTDMIYVGQTLKLPTNRMLGSNFYIVKQGDSLWSIAKNFNTTIQHLKQSNSLTSDMIDVGQILKIPNLYLN